MNLSDTELLALNTFLNGVADLPTEIANLNTKLREHFEQDNTVAAPAPEAEAAPETPVAAPEPVEAPIEAPAEVPAETVTAE